MPIKTIHGEVSIPVEEEVLISDRVLEGANQAESMTHEEPKPTNRFNRKHGD